MPPIASSASSVHRSIRLALLCTPSLLGCFAKLSHWSLLVLSQIMVSPTLQLRISFPSFNSCFRRLSETNATSPGFHRLSSGHAVPGGISQRLPSRVAAGTHRRDVHGLIIRVVELVPSAAGLESSVDKRSTARYIERK